MTRYSIHILFLCLAMLGFTQAAAGGKGIPFRVEALETETLTIGSDLDTLQLLVDSNEDSLQLLSGEQDALDLRLTKIENVLNLVENKKIFVTSQLYTGNLGGLDGADAKCQSAAFNAGLEGTYLAWLSKVAGPLIGEPVAGPLHRFARHGVPYVRPDGVVVANHFGDLVDGTLDNPIAADEFGSTVFSGQAWSSTSANGTPISGASYFVATCGNWTTDAQLTTAGGLGSIGATDFNWSAPGAIIGTPCTQRHRLICVQQ